MTFLYLRTLLIFFCLTIANLLSGQTQTIVDTAATKSQVDSLWKVARDLGERKQYDAAQLTIDQMESTVQNVWGQRNIQMVRVISLRAWVFGLNSNFAASEVQYSKAIALSDSIVDMDKNMYAKLLRSYGMLNRDIGNFEKAIGLLTQASSIFADNFGRTSKEYGDALFTLGTIYYMMGNYSESEKFYLSVKPIFEHTVGKSSRDYASLLDNLAMIYRRLGEYTLAEPLYWEALDIRAIVVGKQHAHYANSLENLGNFYKDLGQFEKSRKMLEECRVIRKAVYSDKHYLYGKILENIAVLLISVRDYKESEKLLLETKEIYRETFGTEHPYYLNLINNLAGLYLLLNNTEKAEKNYEELLSILENKTDKEGYDLAVYLSDISAFYSRIGKFEKAEALFAHTKSLQETYLGKNNPFYIEFLINYGVHSSRMGDLQLSAQCFMEAETAQEHNIYESVNFMSELELENLIFKNQGNSDDIYSVAFNIQHQIPELNLALWNQVFTLKGLLLDKSRALEVIIRNNPDTTVRVAYKNWENLSRSLAMEKSKPLFERDSARINVLEAQHIATEKQLSRMLTQFSVNRSQVTWQRVSESVQPNEVSVEFHHYRHGQSENGDSVFYVALVTRQQDRYPMKVKLFEEKQLQALLEKTGDNAESTTNLYAFRNGEVLGQSPTYGQELYNLIWRPLDSLLHGVKTVYFSPSGLLHRVAFAALPVNGKKMLSDKYELHQLGSTRSLVIKNPEPVVQHYTAAVFGGVQYDRTPTPADSSAQEIADNRLWTYMDRPRAATDRAFDYLPGTAIEAERLTQALQAQRVQVQTYTAAQATEEKLKSLGRDTVKSPDILHIATHGFFFPDPEKQKLEDSGDENIFKWNENPLFRSGLALAGANQAWKGEHPPANIEDGIATAYEISHLNLSNTKLVVLSACETGLGDIKGSEGVYGLQRAFKMAGADYLIVSLWQVPDRETTAFMDVFYKSWLGGKTIHEAFAKAQKKMRKKYKEVYKWGAWVLVE